jgi:hypothetical protein
MVNEADLEWTEHEGDHTVSGFWNRADAVDYWD